MSKLFNIEPKERDVLYYLETFQKNQIVNKIIKGLKDTKKFYVADVESFGDSRIFEIRVFSRDKEDVITRELKETICDIITEKFPLNYQFDFRTRRLGFTYAFNVFVNKNKFCFECYTRKKEHRKDGSSILPEAINQIKK